MRTITTGEIKNAVAEMVTLLQKNKHPSYVIGYLETFLAESLNRCDEVTRNLMYTQVVNRIIESREELKNV